MKITRNQLRRIIKEELGRALLESDPFADLDAAVARKEGAPPPPATQERAEEFVRRWRAGGKPRIGDRDGRLDSLFEEFGLVKHALGTTAAGEQGHRIVFIDGKSFIVIAPH